MGLWELTTLSTPVQSTSTLAVTPYKVYTQYFGPYTTNGKAYNFSSFRDDIREARNHGLNISSSQAHAMRMLAKHQDEWFDENGNLREGLSRSEATRAQKFKDRVVSYYNTIKPRKKKNTTAQTQAKWAANNFIKNGYDTQAAEDYAKISNYNELADLWGGSDVAGVKSGGLYGDKASAAETNYYNSLTAPLKKAYLALRQAWIQNGLIKAATGKSTAELSEVSNTDMKNYIRNHITDWLNTFYGDNGYADEYAEAHPTVDSSTLSLYSLYGVGSPSTGTATWTPAVSPVRTSFALNTTTKANSSKNTKITKAKKVVKNQGKETRKSSNIDVTQIN